MRSDQWRKIFDEEGLRQGTDFVSPDGQTLEVRLGKESHRFDAQGNVIHMHNGKVASTGHYSVQAFDDFITVAHLSEGRLFKTEIFLWEDICEVSLLQFK